jgi:hypothetical protein
MLAAVSSADIDTLFIVLAVLAFALSLFVGYSGNIAAALALAFIGVVILVFG